MLYWIAALDPGLTWDQRLARWVNVSAAVGIAVTVIGVIIGWITSNPWLWVVGLGIWVLLLNGLVTRGRWLQPSTSSEASAEATARTAPQESTIDLGDTARLFLMKGARFLPEDNSERRTIFLPALIDGWVGPFSSAVEAGRTFVAHETLFENCDIYGPAVFVLAEGSIEDTFHKCEWEEEWKAFWPATKPGRYVGAIALKNCTFRRCNFASVAFVVKPDEYKRVYRRFTGADPTEQD